MKKCKTKPKFLHVSLLVASQAVLVIGTVLPFKTLPSAPPPSPQPVSNPPSASLLKGIYLTGTYLLFILIFIHHLPFFPSHIGKHLHCIIRYATEEGRKGEGGEQYVYFLVPSGITKRPYGWGASWLFLLLPSHHREEGFELSEGEQRLRSTTMSDNSLFQYIGFEGVSETTRLQIPHE